MEFGRTNVICILAKKAPKFIEYLNVNLFPVLLNGFASFTVNNYVDDFVFSV